MNVRKVQWLVTTVVVAMVACQCLTSTSQAAETDSKLADARTLLDLMRFDVQMDDALKQCQSMTKTITPESLYQSNPSQFGGITPESRFWPSVVSAFQEFYYTTCSYIDREAFTASAAQSYATALTKQELADSIKFYSSPVGKKLADAQVGATASFQKEAATRLAASYKKANEDFAQKLILLNSSRNIPSGSATPTAK
jgi:hypothetical protein